MANLIGKIQKVVSLAGSIVQTRRMIGRLESLARSKFLRFFVQPAVSIYASLSIDLYMKAFIQTQSSIYSRFMAYKNMTGVAITSKAEISFKASALRNIKINVNAKPIFGKQRILEILDALTLDQMDLQTLEGLEFTEGVVVNVIKNTNLQIMGVASVEIETYVIRYDRLDSLDDMTLNTLDSLTLDEVDQTEV
jgi:hypothetical protein